jgi:hypothetical protein
MRQGRDSVERAGRSTRRFNTSISVVMVLAFVILLFGSIPFLLALL